MNQDRYRGCLVGLAVGDAVGTAVEFMPRGTFPPLTDMIGGGYCKLEVGQWTDDTSMALCLAESLVRNQGFDAGDQMRRYVNWYRYGYLSSTGGCFDIGMTVQKALIDFLLTENPFSGSGSPTSAGNGSLMRLAPVVMYFAGEPEQMIHFARESSRTTHAAPECLDACALFGTYLLRALAGLSKPEILAAVDDLDLSSPKIIEIAKGSYKTKTIDAVKGSGYVVESLEAALWCFAQTDSFEAAILQAANLGDDADTTAAICGQLAGAFYGEQQIPESWLTKLYDCKAIQATADWLWQESGIDSESILVKGASHGD